MDLSVRELYDLLALRATVFVVEQESVYLDPDGEDFEAAHLLGRGEDVGLATYARWYLDGGEGEAGRHVRLGRIVTARAARGRGWGRRTVEAALARIGQEHPGVEVLIHAQVYLTAFYEGYGFTAVEEPFDEDGVPHRVMVRSG